MALSVIDRVTSNVKFTMCRVAREPLLSTESLLQLARIVIVSVPIQTASSNISKEAAVPGPFGRINPNGSHRANSFWSPTAQARAIVFMIPLAPCSYVVGFRFNCSSASSPVGKEVAGVTVAQPAAVKETSRRRATVFVMISLGSRYFILSARNPQLESSLNAKTNIAKNKR